MKKTTTGFTIVELLIVIVVIAVLATISVAAYSGIQQRARDTQRASDLSVIKKALLSYHAIHGGVPSTAGSGTYAAVSYSGWDASISPHWLAFLRADHGNMPVDPKNTMVDTNPPGSGNFVYYYHCYNAGAGPLPATPNVRIGYHKDNGAGVGDSFPVDKCL